MFKIVKKKAYRELQNVIKVLGETIMKQSQMVNLLRTQEKIATEYYLEAAELFKAVAKLPTPSKHKTNLHKVYVPMRCDDENLPHLEKELTFKKVTVIKNNQQRKTSWKLVTRLYIR